MFKKSNKKEKELVEELLKKADALEQEHGDESVLYGDSTSQLPTTKVAGLHKE